MVVKLRLNKLARGQRLSSDGVAFILRAMILVGYPLAAMLATVAGTNSVQFTYPFRAFVVVLAIILLALSHNSKERNRFDKLLVCFFLAYLSRLIYDWQFAHNPFAKDALVYYLSLVFIPVLASMSAGGITFKQERLLAKSSIVIATVVIFSAFVLQIFGLTYNPWEEQGVELDRLWFEALNPISLGHVAGLAFLSSFYLAFEAKGEPIWIRRLSILALGFAIVMLLYANSRGPILAVIMALSCYFFLRLKRILLLFPVIITVLYLILTNNFFITAITERFLGAGLADDLSGRDRIDVQAAAIKAFVDNPFFGAYFLDPAMTLGDYPHNVSIETAMALGILGIGILSAIFIKVVYRMFVFYIQQHPFLAMLIVQQFIATSLSGAIWGSDAFFLVLSLCLTAPLKNKKYL